MQAANLTCLIIEDEPIAAEVLEDYIRQVPFLECRGICRDAIFALDRLKQENIDVIFLDIHLPKLKGLDFLKVLKQKPQTILTTAYHQYALDAFEADVVDYLMKPIEFSRFLQAVNKLKWPEIETRATPEKEVSTGRAFRFFNVNKKMVKVFYDEILYVESLKDYSRIHLTDSTILVRGQIGELESLFQEHAFLRIHRSYLVPVDKISAYSATEVEVGPKSLPIG
ncbi:MAG: response regulator transcription factor, partial [Sinomicrobium sp.]|nr:response regulator transcription factor [Sinomicrobium sp.]